MSGGVKFEGMAAGLYKEKCESSVSKVLKDTRNRPHEEVQKALYAAFPFHKTNLVAWRVYGLTIKKLWGGVLFP